MFRDQVLLAAGTHFLGKVFHKRGNCIGVVPWNEEGEAKFNSMQKQLYDLIISELWTYANVRPMAGSAMVVFDERTKKGMRATVVGVQSSRCKVYLIDTGETVDVPHNRLYPLSSAHTTIFEVPPMAFECIIKSPDAANSTKFTSGSPATSADLTKIERGAIVHVTTLATAECDYPPLNVRVRLETSAYA